MSISGMAFPWPQGWRSSLQGEREAPNRGSSEAEPAQDVAHPKGDQHGRERLGSDELIHLAAGLLKLPADIVVGAALRIEQSARPALGLTSEPGAAGLV